MTWASVLASVALAATLTCASAATSVAADLPAGDHAASSWVQRQIASAALLDLAVTLPASGAEEAIVLQTPVNKISVTAGGTTMRVFRDDELIATGPLAEAAVTGRLVINFTRQRVAAYIGTQQIFSGPLAVDPERGALTVSAAAARSLTGTLDGDKLTAAPLTWAPAAAPALRSASHTSSAGTSAAWVARTISSSTLLDVTVALPANREKVIVLQTPSNRLSLQIEDRQLQLYKGTDLLASGALPDSAVTGRLVINFTRQRVGGYVGQTQFVSRQLDVTPENGPLRALQDVAGSVRGTLDSRIFPAAPLDVAQPVSVWSAAEPPTLTVRQPEPALTFPSPTTKGLYARNVWDMQAFAGKLYLGYGNSANIGPQPRNAGPVPVWAYDPQTGAFASEYTVDDEQIDRLLVLDDRLWIPTHDPRGSARAGFVRRATDGSWSRVATMKTSMQHVYDLLRDGTALYAVGGDGHIYKSADDGRSWADTAGSGDGLWLRTYNLLAYNGQVYAHGFAMDDKTSFGNRMWKLDRTTGQFALMTGSKRADMFPGYGGVPNVDIPRIVRDEVFAGKLVYVAGNADNDHQWRAWTGALYSTDNPGVRATQLPLPAGYLPYDLRQQDGRLQVLVAKRVAPGQFRIAVMQTTDLRTFSEVASIDASTFARSFERLGDSWYFGLGTDTDVLAPQTGQIIRVPATG